MRVVEAQHMAVAIGLVVQSLAHDHVCHREQGGGIGRRPDEDMLVGQGHAGARAARVDADDAHALLLRFLEILRRSRAEGAVGGTPAPHQDQPGVHIVGRLAARSLVVGLRAIGHANREDLGFGRHVRPQLGAAAELVHEALGDAEAVQHRRVARAGGVEHGGVAVGLANPQHLGSDVIERLVPGDTLELPRAARAGAAHRVFQAILVVEALDLADPAGAGVQGWQVGLPARRVGRNLDDAVVHDVGIHHATAAAVVAAGAGDDSLARLVGTARLLVDRLIRHDGMTSRLRRTLDLKGGATKPQLDTRPARRLRLELPNA